MVISGTEKIITYLGFCGNFYREQERLYRQTEKIKAIDLISVRWDSDIKLERQKSYFASQISKPEYPQILESES